ncbi:MAG: cytochrome P450 [Polyangiales bacterium]|jgi:cytochrome P450
MKLGPFPYYVLSDPRDVRHVLVTNHKNYVKSRSYRGLMLALGEGLVTSEGTLWKRQRRLAQPAFHPRAMPDFTRIMTTCTREMLDTWRGGEEVDIHGAMMRLTFRIVGFALLSKDLDKDAQRFGHALSSTLQYVGEYTERLIPFPKWMPTPGMRKLVSDLKVLDDVILRVIEERRQTQTEHHDLLALFMDATDEEGRMSDTQLRDEVITMVSAGHETTAAALAWTFMFLGQHPRIAEQVRREALAAGDGESIDLDALDLTTRVIKESMRLRPPVWVVERQAIFDDELGGALVPAGGTVAMSAYVLHRDPKLWPNPEGFDPDRFLPEVEALRPRFSYLPFGAGPRVCIGGAFALNEAKLILAMVMREWHLELVSGQPLSADYGMTLRPAKPIYVRLRKPASPKVLPIQRAFDALDALNAVDPNVEVDDSGRSRPKELLYAERMSQALDLFRPEADDALRLACRAQHLERWRMPRSDFPDGRTGYLKWRAEAKRKHSAKAQHVLREAGFDDVMCERVAVLVEKRGLRTDEGVQCLEDVACLVFLRFYWGAFHAKHTDEKLVVVLKKTWAKMSDRAHAEALTLPFDEASASLLRQASIID